MSHVVNRAWVKPRFQYRCAYKDPSTGLRCTHEILKGELCLGETWYDGRYSTKHYCVPCAAFLKGGVIPPLPK